MSIGNPRNAREANYLALAATPEEIVERVLLLISQQQQSVNLSSGVSGTLPVAFGGTSVATLTAHGVLVGEGTTAIVSVTGATGQVLHAVTGADPTFSAVSLTADITGVLAETHGGTNQSSYTLGDTIYASAANTVSKLAGNITATRKFIRQTGNGAVSAAPAWDTILAADVPGSSLTKTDDANVTLTLGGSAATALLNAASLTLGWNGQLSGTRGGTGVNNGASTITLGGSLTTSGAFTTTLTVTGNTGVTLPTSGTLVNSAVTTLSSLASIGTIATGTWNATKIGLLYGGTNADLSATGGASQVLKQTSSGGAITVAQLAAADISNGTTGSGAVMLTASPTTTGTLAAAAITASGVFAAAAGSVGTPEIQLGGDTTSGLYRPGANIVGLSISGVEAWRTNAAGYFKASNSGTYNSSAGSYHELVNALDSANPVARFKHAAATATNQYGPQFHLGGDPNDATRYYLTCIGGAGETERATLRSNGGLANFSANDANLSARSVKRDIHLYESVPGLPEKLWAANLAVDYGRWKYLDQTHDDWNHGPTAEGVQEAFRNVAPELTDLWQPDVERTFAGTVEIDGVSHAYRFTKRVPNTGSPLAIYHHDQHNINGAILKFAQVRIERLEAALTKAGISLN